MKNCSNFIFPMIFAENYQDLSLPTYLSEEECLKLCPFMINSSDFVFSKDGQIFDFDSKTICDKQTNYILNQRKHYSEIFRNFQITKLKITLIFLFYHINLKVLL